MVREKGIDWKEYPQTGVIRRLKNRDGWSSYWYKRMSEPVVEKPQSLKTINQIKKHKDFGAVRPASELGLEKSNITELQTAGEDEAHSVLTSFLEERGTYYRKEMSSPVTAIESCSRLSPYITYGNISIKEIFQATKGRVDEIKSLELPKDERAAWLGSLQSFQGRLRWHCHFMQKLEDEPRIEFENMSSAYNGLRESEFDHALFESWCEGETGYPMVDACMKALHQTGWINFRMRAMLVSFASYHLWLHWRETSLFLARLFVDYEPGIHYSQFQMQSGVTGINSVRVYSPAKQVLDQDPEGLFIKRYLPQLENLPKKFLANPETMTDLEQSLFGVKLGKDYPVPVVDHKTAVKQAKDKIYAVRRTDKAKHEAKKILVKHGSRRKQNR